MNRLIRSIGALLCLLLMLPGSTYAVSPENGWWWNPSESGRGFNIEIQGRTVFVATFIYDAAGFPEWFSGGGTLVNDRWSGQLQRFEGGQCPTCSYTPPVPAGTLPFTIQFTGSETATITMGNRTFSVERFGFGFDGSVTDYMGLWSIVSRPGFLTDGEFLVFDQRTSLTDGTPALAGRRLGTSRSAILTLDGNLVGVVVDHSTSFVKYWMVSNEGYNRLFGEFWLRDKDDDPPSPGTGDESTWHRTFQIGDVPHARSGDQAAREALDSLLYHQESPPVDARAVDPEIRERLILMLEHLNR